jgi:hypothetical protein
MALIVDSFLDDAPTVTMKPVEGQAKLREASYRCPRCGADTMRWIGP